MAATIPWIASPHVNVTSSPAQGLTDKAIDERLFISEHTVEKHIGNILATLKIPATADDHRRVLAVITYLDGRH